MKFAKFICLLVIVITTVHFLNAFARVGIDEGAGLDVFLAGYLSDPWQAVIDSDLMVGLLLAACWIGWRQGDGATAFAWIAALCWWGNLVVAIYALRELNRSGGSWTRFFLGIHAADALPSTPRQPWPLAVRGLLWLAAVALVGWIIAGSRAVDFAPLPVIGYLGGLGSLLPALIVPALRGRTLATTPNP